MNNGTQASEPNFLSSTEVAAALATSQSTVSRMVTAGRIAPAFQAPGIRGQRFFHRADVDALVREEREQLRARLQRMDQAVPA